MQLSHRSTPNGVILDLGHLYGKSIIKIINKIKTGQIHFKYKGCKESLTKFIDDIKLDLIESTDSITKNMRARGGGIEQIKLIDKSNDLIVMMEVLEYVLK